VSEVRLDGVSKRYGPVRAVEEVSLRAEEGRFLTLLGPSGCGKTTTLRMIAGLETSDRGRIQIGGRLVSCPEEGVFVPPERRDVGMVFQSYAIWPHMTVFDNVAYPLRIRKRSDSEIRARVETTLESLEMGGLAPRPATDLSGGQQQRVAIARALVFEPAVLLMDEPLSNLDAQLREQMRVQLREMQRRLGITTIYVTHDQEEAMVLADRIAVLHEGRLVQLGPPEEVYRRPADLTVAAFFGNMNLLAGRVEEIRREDGATMARLAGEDWEGWCAAPSDLQVGEIATAVVRPEAIHMSRDPDSLPRGQIAWSGTVREAFFRGSRRIYQVMVGERSVHVDVSPDRRFSPGERVFLRAATEDTWVVR
jgi:iron(III) transport system ATP-binding protein